MYVKQYVIQEDAMRCVVKMKKGLISALLFGAFLTGCAGKYATTGASVVIPTKYDAKTYTSLEASAGGQMGKVRIGGGFGHSKQENDGLSVSTLRYFAEMMYIARNGLYAGLRNNTYKDKVELPGVFEATETINETDAVVGFQKGNGYVETSVGPNTVRISGGANF